VAAVSYDDQTAYPGLYAVLPVLGAAAVIVGGNRALAVRPMTAVGRLSYGWYLWHWPVMIIGPVALGIAGTTPQKLVLAAGALALAWLSLRLVEDPVRYSPVLRSRPRYGLALGGALLTAVVLASLATYVLRPAVPQGTAVGELRLSPGRPEALAEAIRAGSARTELPADLQPSLTAADADLPRVYPDGCHVTAAAVRPASPCAYGDLRSDRTVVLFGDSHAAQWFPALVRIALDRHWRLVSLTKSGCTAADGTIWNDVLQRAYTECDAWRRATMARIRALRPALVVVSSKYVYRLTDPAATWRGAWARTFAALSPAPVAVLSDTPTMNVQVPECLSQHPVSACNRAAAATLRQPQRRILATFGSQVTVIDPVPWLCATICPTVLGNLLVYRDSTHLTTAMSEALAPLLAERLPG
jgi:hypothetical protein